MIAIRYGIGRGANFFGRMFIRIKGHCIAQNVENLLVSSRFCERANQKALRTVVINACVFGKIRLKISRTHFADAVYKTSTERLGEKLVSVRRFEFFYFIKSN